MRALLKNGYRVRGTVRSKAKGEYLRNLFEGQGEFEYVIAEDITKVCHYYHLSYQNHITVLRGMD